jgi:RNA-directed DNA polymerase
MHERGQSDRPVVPANPPNNAGPLVAEAGEERGLGKENAASKPRPGHRAGVNVPSALDRVRRVARQDKDARFTALLHHVDVDRLREAYWALNPKAATGVDGVTWQDYGEDLEANLRDLHDRVHRGAYRARPSRRVYIPKADGRQRPLGVAALEDKILQRAGVDIRGFYDAIDHGWMLKFLEHRIADRRILRLIRKWLKAGVIENGEWSETLEGAAQGASVSPLLSNVYLHYVFDLWAEQWRRRHARGDVVIVRFADDYVVGFQHRDEAERFLDDLRRRIAEFGLELAAEKTRLIEFGRFAAEQRKARGLGKPETFQFLGFTHICGKTRSGRFQLRRITDKKRLRAKLHKVKAECWRRMHQPIPEQGQWLGAVVRGHLNYYAVPGNIKAVEAFRDQATRHWYQALRRRGQKRGRLNWERMHRLAQRWLPPAPLARRAIRRSYPSQEPSALAAHAGICAGGGPSPYR